MRLNICYILYFLSETESGHIGIVGKDRLLILKKFSGTPHTPYETRKRPLRCARKLASGTGRRLHRGPRGPYRVPGPEERCVEEMLEKQRKSQARVKPGTKELKNVIV